MSDVDKVALWAGLIASIVSTVLSVVAIWFAVHVNAHSENVSDQTIRSLQKIETFVQRLSDDTTGLVKAAWDKMLGNIYRTDMREQQASTAKEIASGLTAELKSEIAEQLQPNHSVPSAEASKKLEERLDKWGKVLEAQITSIRAETGRPRDAFSRYKTLHRLPPEARELLRQIRTHHLTRAQYQALLSGTLTKPITETRASGLLVPLKGREDGKEAPVYWFPPGSSESIRSALTALDPNPADIRDRIGKALDAVGYQWHHALSE